MKSLRIKPLAVVLASVLALAACKEAGTVDPIVEDPPVSSVVVTSSLDTLLAAGGPTSTMTAVARDASSNIITGLTFNFTSLTPATATVNSVTGVATPLAAGTTIIRAGQNDNSVTGDLGLRVITFNGADAQALIGDALSQALRGALSGTPQSTLNGLVTTCGTHVASGNLVALRTCLTSAIAVTGTGGNDQALLAVLDLFFEQARRPLL